MRLFMKKNQLVQADFHNVKPSKKNQKGITRIHHIGTHTAHVQTNATRENKKR